MALKKMEWTMQTALCVSELTRQTVINHYHQDPNKCITMHNAVYPLSQKYLTWLLNAVRNMDTEKKR